MDSATSPPLGRAQPASGWLVDPRTFANLLTHCKGSRNDYLPLPTPLNPAGFEPRIRRAPNSGLMCAVCVFPPCKM